MNTVNTPRRPPFTNRKKFVYALFAVVGVVCILEIFADIACIGLELLPAEPNEEKQSDPGIRRGSPLRYEFPPHLQHSWAGGVHASTNSLGMRGREPENPKKKLRVLCIGDSCTHGFARDVTDDKTYPALLHDWLERHSPGRFEVINGGMPNFGTLDCLNFLIHKGLDLEPDYVVFLGGWNDAQHVHGLFRPAARPVRRSVSPFRRSSLYRIGKSVANRLKSSAPQAAQTDDSYESIKRRLEQLPSPTDQLSDVAFKRNERTITCLIQICRANGAEPIVVMLPNFTRPDWTDLDSLSERELTLMEQHLTYWSLSPKGWYEFVNQFNRRALMVCRRNNVLAVQTDTIDSPELFTDVCHPNAEGNELLAKAIGKAIQVSAKTP